MVPKLVRLSVNKLLVDKNVAGDDRLFAEGFENQHLTIEQFADHTRQGHAFAPELSGRRKAANFVAADLVAVDVDEGMSIEEALQHPLVRDHAALMHTTVSHTEEAPRFRIVFRLAETITEPAYMRAIQRSLAQRLGGDAAATDPTRLFFGNRAALFPLLQDRALSLDLQNELIAQSAHALPRGGAIAARPTTRSKLRLDPDQLVTLDTGQTIALSKIRGSARLHCPFHYDRNASAFTVTSKKKVRGTHCAACGQTFWPAGEDEVDLFSFDAAVLRAHAQHGENLCHTGFGPLLGLDGSANIKLVDSGTGLELKPGLTFVKAPKGAGKTEALKRLLPSVKSALLIVHRRTLTRQACRRLNIACYLDHAHLDHDQIGVCFDSLLRLPDHRPYDLVVIDEVEQVLAHILGDTIGGAERTALFRKLTALLRRARYVVVMDADIGWASFTTLTRLMADVIPEPAQGDLFDEMRPQVRLLTNTSKPGRNKAIELYRSKAHLLAALVSELGQGKRVFVASNSKQLAEKISALVAEKVPDCRQLLLTGDNSSGEMQQKFLAAPADETLKYGVIITSPAAGTGLDITILDQAAMIDLVVGFCEADVLTHWDFDQHISRVRQPGGVRVWVTPERRHYETHADVVRRELLDDILRAHVVLSTDAGDGAPTIDKDPLVEMATLTVAQQRASKNNLLANFVAHKREQGFSIVDVHPRDDVRAEARALLKRASAMGDEEYARRIIIAGPLSHIGYVRISEAIEAGAMVSEDQWCRLSRARIEGFYREKVSAGLIERDQRGRMRDRVVLFEDVTQMLPHAPAAIARQSAVIRDPDQMRVFLRLLLEATPLVKDGAWDVEVVFSGDELDAFRRLISENKRVFETQLDRQVRQDFDAKPVLQLGQVLRILGLGLEKARTAKAGDIKRYFYKLNSAAFQQMTDIAHRRAAISASDFLRQLHGDVVVEDDDAEDFLMEPAP